MPISRSSGDGSSTGTSNGPARCRKRFGPVTRNEPPWLSRPSSTTYGLRTESRWKTVTRRARGDGCRLAAHVCGPPLPVRGGDLGRGVAPEPTDAGSSASRARRIARDSRGGCAATWRRPSAMPTTVWRSSNGSASLSASIPGSSDSPSPGTNSASTTPSTSSTSHTNELVSSSIRHGGSRYWSSRPLA